MVFDPVPNSKCSSGELTVLTRSPTQCAADTNAREVSIIGKVLSQEEDLKIKTGKPHIGYIHRSIEVMDTRSDIYPREMQYVDIKAYSIDKSAIAKTQTGKPTQSLL